MKTVIEVIIAFNIAIALFNVGLVIKSSFDNPELTETQVFLKNKDNIFIGIVFPMFLSGFMDRRLND